MSNPGHTRPGGQRPGFTRLPDGRGRMVVLIPLSSGEQLRNDLLLAWGVLYSATERVDVTGRNTYLAGLRLVGGQETQQTAEGWAWVRIYEDIPETAEIQVGKNRRIEKDDGTVEIIAEFLQLAAATATTVTVGSTTAPAPDEATAVLAEQDRQNDGALRRITRRYVSAGLIAESSRDVEDGFADVTWTSVRTELTPPGVVIARAVNKPNGIPVFTVTARGTKAGGGAGALTYSFTKKSTFTLPGRLKPYTRNVTVSSPGNIPSSFDISILNIYQSAPKEVEVDEVHTISYTTDTTPGTITPALWNPTEWTTTDMQYIARGPNPVNYVREWPGYCLEGGTGGVLTVTVTTPGLTTATSIDYICMGDRLFGSNTHTITARGPASPAGTSISLRPDFRPAFVAADGTRWYRKELITVTLPSQTALPV